MTVQLTPEQEAACKAVQGKREAVLTGPAGTGKTTLLRALIGPQTRLGAPTGKAANRLTQVTGHKAETLHRLLYCGPDDDDGGNLYFSDPKPPCEPGETLIVDEASMVGTEIYDDIMRTLPSRARVIWVGDREQLEPVNDQWGPNFDSPDAELTQVHRQAAGNPIIGYATAIRQGRGNLWRSQWDHRDERVTIGHAQIRDAVGWYMDGPPDVTLLTWTHRMRERLNGAIRDRMGLHDPICPGDRLVVKMNSQSIGVMNGEVVTVTSVRFRPDYWDVHTKEFREPVRVLRNHLNDRTRGIWDARKSIGRERWDEERYCHVWHGQCLTVHSSQGSQWDRVGWVFGDGLVRMAREEPDSARRLAYTAVTRAAESLRVFDTRRR